MERILVIGVVFEWFFEHNGFFEPACSSPREWGTISWLPVVSIDLLVHPHRVGNIAIRF